MRLPFALLGVALLSGCAGPAAPAAGSAGGTTHGTAATAPAEPTGDEAGAPIALDGECTSPEGFTVAHPADWAVNAGDVVPPCTRFAPEPFEVRPDSDVRRSAVVLAIEEVDLAQLAGPSPDEVARTDVRVDGRPAVRQVLVTGPGLHPQGTHVTRYLVDLGAGRTLVADALQHPGEPQTQAVDVLDAMMAQLEVGDAVSR